ncbi:MAG: hypothetical protein KAH77_01495 [Thiomargarita sp.]|nr:hypothetical protein [Thiomargarita sp.]
MSSRDDMLLTYFKLMKFEPLFYQNKLDIINPSGDVGILTCWSNPHKIRKLLQNNDALSRVALITNFFGNGLPQLLRNLLYNPQIKHLIICGTDISDSKKTLLNFFELGITPCTFLGSKAFKVIDTDVIIDDGVWPTDFKNNISIKSVATADIFKYVKSLGIEETARDRVKIPMPVAKFEQSPSEIRNHTVLRDTPVTVWKDLIFRLLKFGIRTTLKKGDRLELQNVKCIIKSPKVENIKQYGFSKEHFKQYQDDILSPDLNDNIYTYGNRIHGYFKYNDNVVDSLDIVIQRFNDDIETRHAYVSLWDNARDLSEGHGCPCLVSLFFRKIEDVLTLTAVFRTHNAMNAWLENVYGLMAIQKYVSRKILLKRGAITVISNSITLDTSQLDKARVIANNRRRAMEFDGNGNFEITSDGMQIVACHVHNGVIIKEYRGDSAAEVEREIIRDNAISDVSHAFYVCKELYKMEKGL